MVEKIIKEQKRFFFLQFFASFYPYKICLVQTDVIIISNPTKRLYDLRQFNLARFNSPLTYVTQRQNRYWHHLRYTASTACKLGKRKWDENYIIGIFLAKNITSKKQKTQPPVFNKLLKFTERPLSRQHLGRRPLRRKQKTAISKSCHKNFEKLNFKNLISCRPKIRTTIEHKLKPFKPTKVIKREKGKTTKTDNVRAIKLYKLQEYIKNASNSKTPVLQTFFDKLKLVWENLITKHYFTPLGNLKIKSTFDTRNRSRFLWRLHLICSTVEFAFLYKSFHLDRLLKTKMLTAQDNSLMWQLNRQNISRQTTVRQFNSSRKKISISFIFKKNKVRPWLKTQTYGYKGNFFA